MQHPFAWLLSLTVAGSVLACGTPESFRRHFHQDLARRQNAAAGAAPSATYPGIPPLASITSGMPPAPTPTLFTTFAAGATPPVKGAPPLPTAFDRSAWPDPTKPAPVDRPEIKHWIDMLPAASIPNIPLNVADADCGAPGNAENLKNAKDNGWWYCGRTYTAPDDISVCKDKNTWGVTYDDGPADYTPTLLKYLNDQKTTATFFVIGSAAYWNWQTLQTEHMLGHALSVHTWYHPPLTTQTNEQIVAELGWTMLIIKNITGVTPNTFRPPYGDIDNRVRAVAKMMGLTPVIWSSIGEDFDFDTNDWMIPAGNATGPSSYEAFQNIISNASTIDTGFIVLEHDSHQETVDMSIGYFLPEAKSKALTLQPVFECVGQTLEQQYVETSAGSSPGSANGTTVPSPSNTATSGKPSASSQSSTSSGGTSKNSGVLDSNASYLTVALGTLLSTAGLAMTVV